MILIIYLSGSNNNFQGLNIFHGIVDSGVRTLRYLKELEQNHIKKIVVAETKKNFIEYMQLMMDINGLPLDKLTCML